MLSLLILPQTNIIGPVTRIVCPFKTLNMLEFSRINIFLDIIYIRYILLKNMTFRIRYCLCKLSLHPSISLN